jgi:hypothetical protein
MRPDPESLRTPPPPPSPTLEAESHSNITNKTTIVVHIPWNYESILVLS